MARFHEPVFLKEAIECLGIKKGEKYIDATVGGGGHTEAILSLGGKLLAIDCDPEAIEAARRHLSSACPSRPKVGTRASWQLAQGNFKDLAEIAEQYHFTTVAGILFDLGVSAHQLETVRRGFSFSREAPLDMRMDPRLSVTAADLVNALGKGELVELLAKTTPEYSRRLARVISEARKSGPIESTGQLVKIINQALPKKRGFKQIHPATLCFLALRMAVNDELNNLQKALPQALGLLRPGGRLVVISFHSGEDRVVKHFLREAKDQNKLQIITPKPVRPTPEELEVNPRSRSAKLRVGEKC